MSIRGFLRASRASNSLRYKPETTQSIPYDTSSSVTNTAAKLQAGVIKGELVLRKEDRAEMRRERRKRDNPSPVKVL